MGCGLGWVVGSKFSLCDGLGWVGSVVCCVGLGWVEEIGPTDNSELNAAFAMIMSLRQTVRLSVRHTCESRLHGSGYRNSFYIIR